MEVVRARFSIARVKIDFRQFAGQKIAEENGDGVREIGFRGEAVEAGNNSGGIVVRTESRKK